MWVQLGSKEGPHSPGKFARLRPDPRKWQAHEPIVHVGGARNQVQETPAKVGLHTAHRVPKTRAAGRGTVTRGLGHAKVHCGHWQDRVVGSLRDARRKDRASGRYPPGPPCLCRDGSARQSGVLSARRPSGGGPEAAAVPLLLGAPPVFKSGLQGLCWIFTLRLGQSPGP